jgi:hypothetical protein
MMMNDDDAAIIKIWRCLNKTNVRTRTYRMEGRKEGKEGVSRVSESSESIIFAFFSVFVVPSFSSFVRRYSARGLVTTHRGFHSSVTARYSSEQHKILDRYKYLSIATLQITYTLLHYNSFTTT